MFGTFGNTIKLLRISLGVIRSERELLLFPVFSGLSLLLVLLYVFAAFQYGGTFDRVIHHLDFRTADFIFLLIAYFGGSFVMIYFNTALVAAAHYRLLGGSPDFRFGLESANDRLGALAVWALIASTVGIYLRQLAGISGTIGRAAGFLVSLIGAWATFLVLPVMVVESSTPLESMRRSTEMFKDTWGSHLVPNFGFGAVYLSLFLVAAVPGVVAFGLTGSTSLALVVGLIVYTCCAALVKSAETVFNVALYNYSTTSESDGAFPDEYLRDSFVYRNEKGKFGPPSVPRRAVA